MDERYRLNIGTLTEEENKLLFTKRVCVVGCGGLGGYVIESLGRIGVGYITAVDDDVFDISNLNRQIISEMSLIGVSKAVSAKTRMERINPDVSVTPVMQRVTMENANELLYGHDIVVDAVDSVSARRILQQSCEELKIPLVHGAIGGWYGQVTIIMPGERTFDVLYPASVEHGIEKGLGNPSFTPAIVGSLQACETIKLLIGRGELLHGRVLNIDLLSQEYFIYKCI